MAKWSSPEADYEHESREDIEYDMKVLHRRGYGRRDQRARFQAMGVAGEKVALIQKYMAHHPDFNPDHALNALNHIQEKAAW